MNIGSRPLVSREFNHSKLCETGEKILCLRQYFCVFIQSFFWFSFSLALTSNEGDRLFQLGRLFSPFLFNTAIGISYYNKCSGIQWQPKYVDIISKYRYLIFCILTNLHLIWNYNTTVVLKRHTKNLFSRAIRCMSYH